MTKRQEGLLVASISCSVAGSPVQLLCSTKRIGKEGVTTLLHADLHIGVMQSLDLIHLNLFIMTFLLFKSVPVIVLFTPN